MMLGSSFIMLRGRRCRWCGVEMKAKRYVLGESIDK
jgi:hypothetical protein